MSFTFKHFHIDDSRSAMKVTTDATLLGGWVDVSGCRRVLDIGAGCGVLSLMIAQRCPEARIEGVEIDEGSVEDAEMNFSRAEMSDRLRMIKGDIFDLAKTLGRYDLIISNPPFFNEALPSPDKHRAAARHEQKLSVESLLALSKSLLNPAGRLSFIAPTLRDKEITELIAFSGFIILRTLRFRQREGRPLVRTLWEVSLNHRKPITTTELSIADEKGVYTSDYKSLLHDFMLKF